MNSLRALEIAMLKMTARVSPVLMTAYFAFPTIRS
jgi:hypothetical protein